MWLATAKSAALTACLLLAGCTSLGYYAHLAKGQLALMQAREPISKIIADPARDPKLRERLAYALKARQWAIAGLALPDNGSYSSYAELHRPFTLWNVFAAPELSLAAVEHCFPIAGCVAYRGYYQQARAEAEAAKLAGQGLDSFVAGSLAYSTLGNFDDPIVSPLMRYDDARLAAVIFHELAHQVVYVAGDTAFNESYASFVEQEGGAQWLASLGISAPKMQYAERDTAFRQLLLATREKLLSVYSAPLTEPAKRAAKAEAFAQLQADYITLQASWDGWRGYDWFWATPMNNAKLLPFGLYHQFVPAFAALYAQHARSWPAFHAAVAALAKLPPAERTARLNLLTNDAPLPP